MIIPQFEYAPMKITFKKKVQLADLTPKKAERNLLKEVLFFISAGAFIAVAGIVILILMGALKLIGVKEL
jgi:hypothetical protein